MAEIKTEAIVYLLDYICDKCGKGKMLATGFKLKPHNYEGPTRYPHKCDSCGHEDIFATKYPSTLFKPKDKDF